MNARFETLKTKRTKLFTKRVHEYSVPFNMEDRTIKGLCGRCLELKTLVLLEIEGSLRYHVTRQ